MSKRSGDLVVVTGANGFLALEITHQLLSKGYTVRATVRDPNNAQKTAPLLKLAESLPGALELVAADLSDPNAFDGLVSGAKYVFHTASPAVLTADDPQKEIVDPAVTGAESLLRAVAKAAVRPARVVLTSSIVAVTGFAEPGKPSGGGSRYTDADWNETSTIDKEPYPLSKTLAEKAAWKIAEAEKIDLVTILPSLVVGPAISKDSGSTSAWVAAIVGGGPPLDPISVIDIRDVARAHVAAAEIPEAKGRFIVASEADFDFNRLVAWLKEDYPDAEFAEAASPKDAPARWDNSRAIKELGLGQLVPVRTTFRDAARTLLALGTTQLKPKSA